jgi:hypothetical protein
MKMAAALRASLSLLVAATVATGASAQDLIVMRRSIAPPNPTVSPTPQPPAPVELVNGGFESGSTGWTFSSNIVASANQVRSGGLSAYFPGSATTNGSRISQVVNTVPGQAYTLTGYVYQFGAAEIAFYANGVRIAGTSNGNGGNGAWFLRTGTFRATGATSLIEVVKANNYTGRTAVDDLTLN